LSFGLVSFGFDDAESELDFGVRIDYLSFVEVVAKNDFMGMISSLRVRAHKPS